MNRIISHSTFISPLTKRCWESQKVYAESVGANYKVVVQNPQPEPMSEALSIPYKNSQSGDLVLRLDHDVEIDAGAPNIFEILSGDLMLREFPEAKPYLHSSVPELSAHPYYNVGAMLARHETWGRLFRALTPHLIFRCSKLPHSPKWEAAILLAAFSLNLKIVNLPKHFNNWHGGGYFRHHIGNVKLTRA